MLSNKIISPIVTEWNEEGVSRAEILRLIYQGRFLHGNVTLGALGLPPGRTSVMHLVPRETLPEPNSQGTQMYICVFFGAFDFTMSCGNRSATEKQKRQEKLLCHVLHHPLNCQHSDFETRKNKSVLTFSRSYTLEKNRRYQLCEYYVKMLYKGTMYI